MRSNAYGAILSYIDMMSNIIMKYKQIQHAHVLDYTINIFDCQNR